MSRPVPVPRTLATILAALVLVGCSLRTPGVDDQGIELTAAFTDVRNLVVGHAVRVSDVQVGTVTGIELAEDFTAEVTMVLDRDVEVPVDTTAVIAKTSLLGENFVALQYPDAGGQLLTDGGTIQRTIVLPEIEQVSAQAIELLGAVLSADLDVLVEETVTAIGGRGEELQVLVGDIGDVAATYAGRTEEIAVTIDGLAALGRDLAAGADTIDTLVVELDEATASVGAQRGRILVTLEELTDLAEVLNDEVLAPHGATLSRTLERLDPVVGTLAEETDRLGTLLDQLLLFSTNVPRAVVADNAQVYGYLTRQPGQANDLEDLLDPDGGGPGLPPAPADPPNPLDGGGEGGGDRGGPSDPLDGLGEVVP